MIMNDISENEVTISGELQTGTFHIRESAKAFAILSSSLYSKKIRAIIRELSCNCRDSRIAAGMSEDFFVHLPTRMEPEFWVKDEGLGLSNDEVMNLYTTYFESTKTSSNQFVGALGLGSKSPFSYTENFTVTAIKDGIRGVYSAYIDEKGVPAIVCLLQGPTDEPNGVEVRMAVAEKDHREFLTEAQSIYNWFDIKPSCNLPIDNYYQTKEFKNKDYSTNSSSKSIIIMGGVAYDFELSDFVKLTPSIKFLFRVSIGDVDVLPSREGLQNTAKTKEVIVSEYTRIMEVSMAKVKVELDSIDATYEKLSYLNANGGIDLLENHAKIELKNSLFSKTTNNVAFSKLGDIGLKCVVYSQRIGKKAPKAIEQDNITPSRYVKFIYNDIGASIKAIKEQCKVYDSTIYIFSKLGPTSIVDFEKFRNANLLGANVTLASEFVVKQKRVSVSTRNVSGIMVPTSSYSSAQYRLKNGEITVDTRFYVRLDVDNKCYVDGHLINLTSIVTVVGQYRVVFLKKTSKADVSKLTNAITYIESLMLKPSKYKFHNMNYDCRNLRSIIDFANDNSLNIIDPILSEVVQEYFSFNECSNTTNVASFIGMHSELYPDTRILYSDKILSDLEKKYDIIDACSITNSKLLEVLLNVIHSESLK